MKETKCSVTDSFSIKTNSIVCVSEIRNDFIGNQDTHNSNREIRFCTNAKTSHMTEGQREPGFYSDTPNKNLQKQQVSNSDELSTSVEVVELKKYP